MDRAAARLGTQAYPIVFLYRHYLELELKSVAALGCVRQAIAEGEDGAESRVQAILGTHDLVKLCDACREICEQAGLYAGRFAISFEAFAACFQELDALDHGSYAFRYPIDKKLNQNLTMLGDLDLPHLKEEVAKLARFVAVIRHAVEKYIDENSESQSWTDEDERVLLSDITGLDEEEAQWESGYE